MRTLPQTAVTMLPPITIAEYAKRSRSLYFRNIIQSIKDPANTHIVALAMPRPDTNGFLCVVRQEQGRPIVDIIYPDRETSEWRSYRSSYDGFKLFRGGEPLEPDTADAAIKDVVNVLQRDFVTHAVKGKQVIITSLDLEYYLENAKVRHSTAEDCAMKVGLDYALYPEGARPGRPSGGIGALVPA